MTCVAVKKVSSICSPRLASQISMTLADVFFEGVVMVASTVWLLDFGDFGVDHLGAWKVVRVGVHGLAAVRATGP